MSGSAARYGVVEGFYGPLWSWDDRERYRELCAGRGFSFYLYAPKQDVYLRDDWRRPWPDATRDAITRACRAFQASGVDFGIGLSPLGVDGLDAATREALRRKVGEIDAVGPRMLSVQFDDMTSATPNLAGLQAEICDFVAGVSRCERFAMVGTYYSRDPVLELEFGPRPKGYWSDLGRALDPRFDVFWTGDRLFALGFDRSGLEEIGERFRRPPLLWDNYPVNDAGWLAGRLFLYPFVDRGAWLAECTRGHGANPMVQPNLSRVPVASLAEVYRRGPAYDAETVFRELLRELCGEALGAALDQELLYLQLMGRDHFDDPENRGTRERLRDRFAAFDGEREKLFTAELLAWLGGT